MSLMFSSLIPKRLEFASFCLSMTAIAFAVMIGEASIYTYGILAISGLCYLLAWRFRSVRVLDVKDGKLLVGGPFGSRQLDCASSRLSEDRRGWLLLADSGGRKARISASDAEGGEQAIRDYLQAIHSEGEADRGEADGD